jgi:hypothetical protein
MNNHCNFGFITLINVTHLTYLSNGTSNQVELKNDILGQDAQWVIMKWEYKNGMKYNFLKYIRKKYKNGMKFIYIFK